MTLYTLFCQLSLVCVKATSTVFFKFVFAIIKYVSTQDTSFQVSLTQLAYCNICKTMIGSLE